MTKQHVAALAKARSFLFVPADRPERFAKALSSGADAVIVDLEDAVAPGARTAARTLLHQGLATVSPTDRGRMLVRINAAGTHWHDEDSVMAAALARQGLGGIMLAKAENPAVLAALAAACAGAALVPLVETGSGLDALDRIAAMPYVLRLSLGHLDLQNDMGIACGPDEAEIAPARWGVVRASRRAGLAAPIDGVTADTREGGAVEADAARSVRMGFGAKLCIHPVQVSAVHRAFTPGAEQLDWARRVLAAATSSGGQACTVDGKMVDAPVIELARRLMARVGD